MKKEDQPTVKQILYQMRRSDETKEALTHTLAKKAAKQEHIEAKYNELVTIARLGIDFVNQIHEGDVLTPEKVSEGQKLLMRVLEIIQEDPSSTT